MIWGAEAYLENFDYNLLVVCNVYSLEHFTVFPTAKLSHQLIVILIPLEHRKMICHFLITQLTNIHSSQFKRRRYMVRWCSVPPLHNMGFIIPVLAGPLCVHIGVNSGSAGHRAGHVPLEISRAPASEKEPVIAIHSQGELCAETSHFN